MDAKIPEHISPLVYRLTELTGNQNALPVLVAFGVVFITYLLYNVRHTD